MILDYGEFLYEREQNAAKNAILKVAICEGKTVEEVREAMIEAIEIAIHSPEEEVRARWAQIPCKGTIPTPEEVIVWICKML